MMMGKIYADLLLAERKVWKDVPEIVKKDVKKVLEEAVEKEVIDAEAFKSITGEEYAAAITE